MNELEMNSLWAKWILTFAFVVMIGGICFAFIFPYMLPNVMESFFTEITGMKLNELNPAEIRFQNLLSGVIGATMFGWGLMLAFLGYRLVQQPVAWIWTALTASLIAWYISDTLTSIMAGSSLNVLLNTTILLLAAPPLIANRRHIVKW
ncbi:MAG: hypothetical protein ACE5I5_08010 [Candidatus Heimdallarchaeota archaeon]